MKHFLVAATAMALLGGATGLSAAVIPVINPSFETLPAGGLPMGCGAGCSFSANDAIPGWNSSGQVCK